MDAKPFWDFVSSISFGTVVAWILGISAIITALCAGTIKLYKLFTKYKEAKDREQEQEGIIKNHDATLQDIDKTLREIKVSLEEQKEVNLKQIRHTIVHTCEDALDKGEISINKLRSLEEMYDEYVKIFHGNGYVKTLVMRVRKLKIVGNCVRGEVSTKGTFETKRRRIYGTTNGFQLVELLGSEVSSRKAGETGIIIFGNNFAKKMAESLISKKFKPEGKGRTV